MQALPSMAQTPRLHPRMTPLSAMQTVMLETLRQLQANVPGVLANADVEFVHQARVALRRLRSAQKAFAELAPAADWRIITAEIRWLATLLGEVRNLDVLLAEILPSIEAADELACDFAALKQALNKQRQLRRRKLGSALTSLRYARLRLRILQWLHDVAPRYAAGQRKLRAFAHHALRKRRIQVETLAAQWHSLDQERRHDLRKQTKKLRYAVEFFSPLYDGRRVTDFLEKLKTLQRILGTMNDAFTAQTTIRLLVRQDPFLELAGSVVVEWMQQASTREQNDLDKAISGLKQADSFW